LISDDTLALIGVVAGSISSGALNTGAIEDGLFKDNTPMKDIQHPAAEQKKAELSPEKKFALEYQQKQPKEVSDPKIEAYFDARHRYKFNTQKVKDAYEIIVTGKGKSESVDSEDQSFESTSESVGEGFGGTKLNSFNHNNNNLISAH
jgi:hypothetical protein